MPQTIITTNNLIDEWVNLEGYFSNNNYNPIDSQEIIYLKNTSNMSQKVLFCAPHALNHYRDNKLKIADVFTGSLCQLLSKNTNQPGLVSTRPFKDSKNLGFGDNFINRIADSVDRGLMVVDIHGMSDHYNCDICIGTGPNPSSRVTKLADRIISDLPEYKVSINCPFDAVSKHTITNFVQTKLMGDSIQIEIASRLRRPDRSVNDCQVFLTKTMNLINEYLV